MFGGSGTTSEMVVLAFDGWVLMGPKRSRVVSLSLVDHNAQSKRRTKRKEAPMGFGFEHEYALIFRLDIVIWEVSHWIHEGTVEF